MKRIFTPIIVLLVTGALITNLSGELTWQNLLAKNQLCKNGKLTTTLEQNVAITTQEQSTEQPSARAHKEWNFMVYFAANNNLNDFAIKNIKQMLQVGSTGAVNVLIQLDELGAKKATRYYIQKNNATVISTESGTTECVSGTPESLYAFVNWAIKAYPANHQCLVLWNHGSGIKDPSIWGRIVLKHRDELFMHNEKTGLFELNRRFMREQPKDFPAYLIDTPTIDPRGIAFNDTFETYLTNQDLKNTLEKICHNLLNGQKLDLLCMDACHMEMIEVGSQIKNTAKIMVGSEEVEPGAGYDYSLVLAPFSYYKTIEATDLAKIIVKAYDIQYKPTHGDYTQSALNIASLSELEKNFTEITQILTTIANGSAGSICIKLMKDLRFSSENTTEFSDPDYIDLGHFYKSLNKILNKNFSAKAPATLSTLKEKVAQGIKLLQTAVIANAAGPSLSEATGLAFYFPIRNIHSSYYKTVFDQTTKWSTFLNKFIKTRQSGKKAGDAVA